ncbi:MAG: ribbon-helix-helix domain-containing protein [Patescibacteria group bacterium]|nr:ribbon-helix-helix domain-containing protein [Patescibacteria group bacterium]
MRAVINISLPQPMATVVNNAVSVGNYSSKSEFFRSLLRNWMEEKVLFELKQSQKELQLGKGKVLKSLKNLR